MPQGRHVHGLLPTGARALGELFPGLLDDPMYQQSRPLLESAVRGRVLALPT